MVLDGAGCACTITEVHTLRISLLAGTIVRRLLTYGDTRRTLRLLIRGN